MTYPPQGTPEAETLFKKDGTSITPKVAGNTLESTPIGQTSWEAGRFTTLKSHKVANIPRRKLFLDNAWTSRSASEANNWESVTWSPKLGLFVAVANSGTNRVMTSPDGITWTSRSALEASGWELVTWSPELGLFVAVANSGTNQVMTSPDGITWTSRSASEASYWYSVTWSPELRIFVAVADSGTNQVMTSPDGITWTSRSASEASYWYSVTWSPELGIFVAVADFGTNIVMTSPDGITWTSRSASEASNWYSVAWSPELGIFVAVAYGGTNRVMTSPDGITWTSRSASEANEWRSVTWSPELGLFVAVANSGTNLMTSPDGITWTSRSASEASNWYSVAWSPELGIFVAVAYGGTNRVMTSFPTLIDNVTRRPPEMFMDLLVASTSGVRMSSQGNATVQILTTQIINPDVPRNISITATNVSGPSGNVIIAGKLPNGQQTTENIPIVPGGTGFGNEPFGTISSITIPATVLSGDAVDVGYSDKLGLSSRSASNLIKLKKNNADATSGKTIDSVYKTVNVSNIAAGDDITVWYHADG